MDSAPTNQEWDLEKKQMQEELQELRGLNRRLQRQLMASMKEKGMSVPWVFIDVFSMCHTVFKLF